MGQGYTYIITNAHNTTLYVGVTSDLPTRIVQHSEGIYMKSFSRRYNLHKLVYYEEFDSIEVAIAREKQMKAGSRKKKEQLVSKFNPQWRDLYEEVKYW